MGGTGVWLLDPRPAELKALHTHGGHGQGAKWGTQGQAGFSLSMGRAGPPEQAVLPLFSGSHSWAKLKTSLFT